MRQRSKPTTATKVLTATELRARLEAARLDLRALYRSLDRMRLAQELPVELDRLQELDADFAEALWVLDQPAAAFDRAAMARDTVESLGQLPATRERFFALFDDATRGSLEERVQATRDLLSPEDAYLEIPGRNRSA